MQSLHERLHLCIQSRVWAWLVSPNPALSWSTPHAALGDSQFHVRFVLASVSRRRSQPRACVSQIQSSQWWQTHKGEARTSVVVLGIPKRPRHQVNCFLDVSSPCLVTRHERHSRCVSDREPLTELLRIPPECTCG